MNYLLILFLVLNSINSFAYRTKNHRKPKHNYSNIHESVNNCLPPPDKCPSVNSDDPNNKVPESVYEKLSQLPYNIYAAKKAVNEKALTQAIHYYLENYNSICNKKYITLVDYTQDQDQKRFTIIDIENSKIETFEVANGSNTDPDHDGSADRFSNALNSNASSIGFFLTGQDYKGTKGHSLKLNGLSGSKYNSNACERGIILHGDAYSGSHYKVTTGGRSSGCLTLSQKNVDSTIEKLKNGSLIYSYHDQLDNVYSDDKQDFYKSSNSFEKSKSFGPIYYSKDLQNRRSLGAR